MASAAWKVDVGSGYATPPQTTTGGTTITLKLDSVTGADKGIEWKCTGTHNSTVPIATIQALMDAGLGGTPNGQTCSFALPAGTGQNYIFQCTVNNGKDANGEDSAALVQTGSVNVLNDAGAIPIAINEDLEVNSTHGVVPRLNAALNNTGGLTAPANPADDNKIAIGSGGDLAYSSATLSSSALALGSRNITTTGNISGAACTLTGTLTGVDADFSGDVTANSLTTGGSPPTGVEVGLENAGQIAWNGASSGTATLELNSYNVLEYTSVSGHSSEVASEGWSGGTSVSKKFRKVTTNSTDDTSITQALASGQAGVLVTHLTAFDQAAPTTNRLSASWQQAVSNDGGTINFGSVVAAGTAEQSGDAANWVGTWSDGGSNSMLLTLDPDTGSGAGTLTITWFVTVELTHGSLS